MRKSQTIPAALLPLFSLLLGFAVGLLASCAALPEKTLRSEPLRCSSSSVCPPCPSCATPEIPEAPSEPLAKALQKADWGDLPGWTDDDLTAAWPAFLRSCQALASRPQWPLWRAACDEAKTLTASGSAVLRDFFTRRFEPYQLSHPDGTTAGLVTGYYEPLLNGSRSRSAVYAQPVLGVPPDLLRIDLSAIAPDLKNRRLRGRLQGNTVVPYYSRAEIVDREPEYADRVLLWVDDAVELFFLQIQGSGRVRLPNGELVRLSYADQNGYPYRSIGQVLLERGELTPEQASMQGIQAWARQHPDKLKALLNANPSYVFFRERPPAGDDPDDGPPGALAMPLTPGRSIAVDPRYVPLGAPVFLATSPPDSSTSPSFPLRRLVMAQDTGGAIRGIARADYFWGFGPEAGARAGRMKQPARLWVLLPPGAAPKE